MLKAREEAEGGCCGAEKHREGEQVFMPRSARAWGPGGISDRLQAQGCYLHPWSLRQGLIPPSLPDRSAPCISDAQRRGQSKMGTK